jgi:hypothetical protein
VADYAVRLVMATRDPARYGLDSLSNLIAFGASPRASIGLVEGARAMALLRGRGAVDPQDIYDIAYDVLNHRLVLSFDAVADGVTVDEVLYHLLTTIPAPTLGGHAPPASIPPASPLPAASPDLRPAAGRRPLRRLADRRRVPGPARRRPRPRSPLAAPTVDAAAPSEVAASETVPAEPSEGAVPRDRPPAPPA